MPIEFACKNCTKLLRVPDGTQGQSCECPACGRILLIPGAVSNAKSKTGARKPMQQLTIPCPQCRFELRCDASLLGTKGQCRNCSTIFTISEHVSAVAAAEDTSALVFTCPKCDQLFAGQTEMEGRKGKCHACGEVFIISLKPAELKAAKFNPNSPNGTRATPAISETTNAAAQRPRPPQPPAPNSSPTSSRKSPQTKERQSQQIDAPTRTANETGLQFCCIQCNGIMEVPRSAIGQSTQCPYCQQIQTIPSSPESSKTTQLDSMNATNARVQLNGVQGYGERTAQHQDPWAELGDSNGPIGTPAIFNAQPGANTWKTQSVKKTSDFTFSNAFSRTFQSLFPSCLIASAVYIVVSVCTSGLMLFVVPLLAISLGAILGIPPQSTESTWVVMGSFALSAIPVLLLGNAALCMTCKVALHAMRGQPISPPSVFQIGSIFGGTLVVLLGWTAFIIAFQYISQSIVTSMARAGQTDSALVVLIVLFLFSGLLNALLYCMLAYVPFALLDGQSLSRAISTSSGIFYGNFFKIIGINLCGCLLFVFVSTLTCGFGFIVLVGSLAYLNAAVYQLANRTS